MKKPDLVKDQRGAIMLSGVVMAAFLIAAIWFVVGVGDAIFFKVRAQESADHVAYSSAVVHARGMNFISAMNAIMYAITAVHIVMGILHDLFKILAPIADICAANPFTAAVCVPIATFLHIAIQVLNVARPVWRNTAVAVGLPAAATAQTIAAKGYPAYAATAGAEIGRDYKKTALAVSASLKEEVGTGRNEGKRQRGHEQSLKLGLPVVAQKMKTLCEIFAGGDASSLMPASAKNGQKDLGSEQDRARKEIPKLMEQRRDIIDELRNAKGARREQLLRELSKKDEEIKKSIELSKKEDARRAGDGLTSAITKRYCPEATWDNANGPKALFEGTKNGGAILQTWGFTTGPGYVDRTGNIVAVGTQHPERHKPGQPKTPVYYAQAELYFDCAESWKHDDCNGDEKLYDKSMYAMNWRARLVRVDPNELRGTVGGLVTPAILQALDRKDATYSDAFIENTILRSRGRTLPKGGLVLH